MPPSRNGTRWAGRPARDCSTERPTFVTHLECGATGEHHPADQAHNLSHAGKPLLAGRWAGAIDTVGGDMLSALLASVSYRGCVAACGLVAGAQLSTTLYPFLLRGVTLAGIDSAQCPMARRLEIWRLLAHSWRPPSLQLLTREISLSEVPAAAADMLAGRSSGRVLVRPYEKWPLE